MSITEPVGNTREDFDPGRKVVLDNVDAPKRPAENALSYQEKMAVRKERLRPMQRDVGWRIRAAEADLSFAQDRLGTVMLNVALGEASEHDVVEVEEEIARCEREIRRWTAAHRELDSLRGIGRDDAGNIVT